MNPYHSLFESSNSKENKNVNRRYMFKRVDKINYSPRDSNDNKILPDVLLYLYSQELIDCPIENFDDEIKLPTKNNSVFRSKIL